MCRHCGHEIGYHWLRDERCTAKDCDCPGFEPVEEKREPLPR